MQESGRFGKMFWRKRNLKLNLFSTLYFSGKGGGGGLDLVYWPRNKPCVGEVNNTFIVQAFKRCI